MDKDSKLKIYVIPPQLRISIENYGSNGIFANLVGLLPLSVKPILSMEGLVSVSLAVLTL